MFSFCISQFVLFLTAMKTVIPFVLLFQVLTIVFCVGDERVREGRESEDFSTTERTEFLLFTKKNSNQGQVIALKNYRSLGGSNFDASKKTKVVIHGWLGESDSPINKVITSAYLRYHDVNVIVVNWGKDSRTLNYYSAAGCIKKVGEVIAEFLDFLLGSDVKSWENLSLVGYSLGAHVAGFAGQKTKNGRVGTIVALDPGL